MKVLDSLSFPLSGASLIEASAGTGKTYTIVNLYLRLLLGHQCPALGVEKILVVTFTNAATAELKGRIRKKLRQTYLDFFAGHSNDEFVQGLLAQLPERELACQRLALATKQMDEAAIFTIHGFSLRMLTQHAFESGAMYEQSLILDESEWLKLALEDYWRKYIVGLEPYLLSMVLKLWSSPDALLLNIRNLLYRRARAQQSQSIDRCQVVLENYSAHVQQVKSWWLQNNVAEQLSNGNLNGRSKLAKGELLDAMQLFCHSGAIEPNFDKDGWGVFSQEKLQKALKKGSVDLSHLDFGPFDDLSRLQQSCFDSIRLAFSAQALEKIAENLAGNKQRLHLLAPDDLLSTLQHALSDANSKQSQALATAIVQTYPAVLIDEFQDTDPVQFAVFKGIYGTASHSPAPCWIMIGDPKQAIYAFRGADIFTYIEAKQLVGSEQQFTLNTNWRSQGKLVEAINGLFTASEQGFLYQQSIPFHPVMAAKGQSALQLGGQTLPALQFQHLRSTDGKPLPWSQVQQELARQTAAQISHLLYQAQAGEASIHGQPLRAGDCCVLVRDRQEADVIKQALFELNVASVFLVRKSVFATQLAQDLFMLLKALSKPGDERLIKNALMSELFAMTAAQIDDLLNNDLAWQQIIEHCYQWHRDWQQQGLMLVLNKVSRHFDLEHKLVSHYVDGLRRLTDLRHLSELLQQQSKVLQGEAHLLHWFEQRLLDPDHNHEGQQLRLETDANLVQIITQHAAKGLEFPLVFIPFACRFKGAKEALYHNEQQELVVDLLAAPEHLLAAERERLAEDTRLLYVALTRAVYFCSVGIWNNAHSQRKGESGLLASALGCLLLKQEEQPSDELIITRLTTLAKTLDIGCQTFEQAQQGRVLQTKHHGQDLINLQLAQLRRPVKRQWRLTSYSALSSQQQHLEIALPGMDEGHDPIAIVVEAQAGDNMQEAPLLSPFTFERGAKAGSFLHGVLENVDFQRPEQLSPAITQQGLWFGIDELWYPMLDSWLGDVLSAPFAPIAAEGQGADLCLRALSSHQVKVEMEFFMPLLQVKVEAFNQLINQYQQQHARQYQFEELNGMIKGFIDLMFEFNGKFYVADYKSNHLGDDLARYHPAALEQAMTDHDYHLQAILYTLALHRWLGQKLPDYQYETHVGGAYYLFLRGMSTEAPGSGVYHLLPDKQLIMGLDKLFSGMLRMANPYEAGTGEKTKQSEQPQQQQGQLDLW
ncbi:MAG: exodeoxyribonuclease V beta subunit [Paraglaciecola sp.]|jgi:exodeoxyribonuclease V beta subunit